MMAAEGSQATSLLEKLKNAKSDEVLAPLKTPPTVHHAAPTLPLSGQPQQAQLPNVNSTPHLQTDSLQPQLAAARPAAESDKRKRAREVDVPDVDFADKDTFSVLPLASKFSKWLGKCIQTDSASFTRGDAKQVATYAERHADNYFALKEGWVRFLRSLDSPAETLKAWYAFDVLLSLPEFKKPAVRATWELNLPELVYAHMELDGSPELAAKYFKLLGTWRPRLDPDTMLSIRKKLAHAGVALPSPLAVKGEGLRFKYKVGQVVEFLGKTDGTWTAAVVNKVDVQEKTVALQPTAANSALVTLDMPYAVRNTRVHAQARASAPPAKKRRRDERGDSPGFA